MINVYTDGGARGNPGPAAIGVYITDGNGNVLKKIGRTIGNATNNVAEYKAVIDAFSWLLENYDIVKMYEQINFFLDSQLVVSQLNGLYKVKNENLRSLLFTIREKEAAITNNIRYTHIPREKNKEADALVNIALDNAR